MKISKRKWAELRLAMYGVAVAVGVVLQMHKIATKEQVDAYLLVVNALLLVAMRFVDLSGGEDSNPTGE